ncbi:uncharacterized protein LOC142149941 isoform X4 [Mixophyes fleayi]|uniref:uncharacterized protein LOC142149941 isoform X4 n=1 Tax=Mixophyes fleayi TaxID=3061075 RepID=UPI003F4DBABF
MNYVQKILIFTLFPYSLAVQDNEMRTTNITCHSSKIFIIPSMKDLSIHIVAGTIGGIVVFVGILLLIWFCIKRKGKQMKTNHSPPNAVALPDDYECTPYAVSERKDQNLRSMYSLVQAPKLATDAEYSEVEMKALGVPGAEYSEIKMKPPVVACAVYSEIELKPGGDDAYTMVGT